MNIINTIPQSSNIPKIKVAKLKPKTRKLLEDILKFETYTDTRGCKTPSLGSFKPLVNLGVLMTPGEDMIVVIVNNFYLERLVLNQGSLYIDENAVGGKVEKWNYGIMGVSFRNTFPNRLYQIIE